MSLFPERGPIVSRLIIASFILAGFVGIYSLGSITPGVADERGADQNAPENQVLHFGIVPQQSASRLAKIWGPVAKHLSERIGVDVVFQTTKNIPTFEACLRDGVFDIAYMNPYHYVIFSERSEYRALAHQSEKKLRGLMVVRNDSDIGSSDDLEGRKIAFPSPGAFGASVVPRAEMLSKGISFAPSYVKSHDSVYRAVAAGLADAGGGVARTLRSTDPKVRDQLRVIMTTDAYTPHAIATSLQVSDATREAVIEAFLDLSKDAPDLLEALGMSGFVAATDSDWDDVRALGLEPEQAGLDKIEKLICPFD